MRLKKVLVLSVGFGIASLFYIYSLLLADEFQPRPFRWIRGEVKAFVSQEGNYNIVSLITRGKKRELVRFCSPITGADIEMVPENLQYDLLKTAYLKEKSVNVGVRDFGRDALGSPRLCIERVIF